MFIKSLFTIIYIAPPVVGISMLIEPILFSLKSALDAPMAFRNSLAMIDIIDSLFISCPNI